MDKNKMRIYKEVFDTPNGKKVLKDIMDFCHIMGQLHDPNNSHNTAFNDGKRRVALRILSFLKPEEIVDIYNSKDNLIKYEDLNGDY